MTNTTQALRDKHGRPMFICPDCGVPLSANDVFQHGLRMPDFGETPDEYLEAELLDNLSHIDCLRARRAG